MGRHLRSKNAGISFGRLHGAFVNNFQYGVEVAKVVANLLPVALAKASVGFIYYWQSGLAFSRLLQRRGTLP